MENYIKNNIQGEIFIPLETYYKQQEINKIKAKNISNLNYKSFRSIVFTNEYLHFFLAIFFEPDDEKNKFNICNINEYIKNNCSINIQYTKKFEEKEDENLEMKNLKDDIIYALEENKENSNLVNNGILEKIEILEEKNAIIYELYSKIQLKDSNNNCIINNTKVNLNINITTNKRKNSYDDLDINDINIINYININNDSNQENDTNISSKKYVLFNISKTLTVMNPLKINSVNQYDCGNNKYLLTIKLENITYKINFIDQTLKNSSILKKDNKIFFDENDKLHFEFPIILTNIYTDDKKTLINDILLLNFLKFEQERNTEGKFDINSNNISYNILNDKFPVIINPKEVYNLVISIEKRLYNYLIINDIKKKEKTNFNMINQLIKLTIATPLYINIATNKPIHNLIWNFSFKWKDEINNKLNISFKIDKNENIKLYNFFKVVFFITKTHKEKLKIEFRFNNSYEEYSIVKNSNKKISDNLPDIFPEKKIYDIELNENEFEKNIEIRYMPIRKEYIEFPPFEIFDNNLEKIYLAFFTNKIYVNQ